MRRALTILLCFLILGAAVNVGIAWSIAWFIPEHELRDDPDAERMTALSHVDHRTWLVDIIRRPGMVHLTGEPGWTIAPLEAADPEARGRIPGWSIVRRRPPRL